MNYFDGLYFSLYGMLPVHRGESHHVPVYYGVQYNHSGRFFLRIDRGELLTAEGPHVFLTHPGAYFEYGNLDGESRSHNFICVYGERVGRYLESGLFPVDPARPLIRVRNPERFLETMGRIVTTLRAAAPAVPPRAVLLYEDLLLQLHDAPPPGKRLPAYQNAYFTRLAQEIRLHPELGWDFQTEAARRGLSSAHFRRLFRQLTGLPPQQFLIRCRLQLAAELLASTGDPVGRIAERVGIGNEFYFSRLFREKFESSPLEYRREFSVSSAGSGSAPR